MPLTDPVLDAIHSFPQDVVLQIQNLETCVYILDKLANLQWSAKVSHCD